MNHSARQDLLAQLCPGAQLTGNFEITQAVTLSQYAYERHVHELLPSNQHGAATGVSALADHDRQVSVITSLTTDTGEGYSGDFDPEDPDDLLLFRFDVEIATPGPESVRAFVEDASYCTQLPAVVPAEMALRALCAIHQEAVATLTGGGSIKKAMEKMSWIGPGDFTDQPQLQTSAQEAIAQDRALPPEQRG